MKILFLITILFIGVSVTGCLDEPPAEPPHDNPWDPLNTNAPRPPGTFRALAISEDEVMLTWQDRSGNETGYHIYEEIPDESPVRLIGTVLTAREAENGTIDTAFFDNRPLRDTLRYEIEAYNDYGRSYLSTALTSTVKAPPLKPTDLEIQQIDNLTLQLTWTDNSEVEDEFELQRSVGTRERFVTDTTIAANSDQVLLDIINPQTNQFFRLRAVNSFGRSDFSNVVMYITP